MSSSLPSSPAGLLLSCPNCRSSLLECQTDRVTCPKCVSYWPIENGIPRLFKAQNYWGEIPREEAQQFLKDAKERGWRLAAELRFGSDRNMITNILDWQRASWLQLLPCASDGRALDVGSGYGTITHALSRAMAEVYSLEAVTERIEFTRLRLEQEGVRNVRLVQGSALELPFSEQMFDLIVVNGVLEWLGEWEQEGHPRSIQIRFLNRLREMLKPHGMLLVGIENRIGVGLLCGEMDHSALPFTSLMPRRLASFYLRHRRAAHHRTQINPRREYRTYTYTKPGYEKLLGESGFAWTQFYWADPGYNQPYSLVPANTRSIRQRFERTLGSLPFLQDQRRTLRNRIKGGLVSLGIFNWIVPDFVIFAGKTNPARAERSDISSPVGFFVPASRPDGRRTVWTLSTAPFGEKTVLFGADERSGKVRTIAKISTLAPGSADKLREEYQNLSLVSDALKNHASPAFLVAEPQGCTEKGIFTVTLESSVAGTQFSKLALSLPTSKRIGFIARLLSPCLAAMKQLAEMLDKTSSVKVADEAPWQAQTHSAGNVHPSEIMREYAPIRQETRREYETVVQHGDFTLENIFWDPTVSALSVIDWKDLRRGLPPLYDVVSLLISILPVLPESDDKQLDKTDPLQALFSESFFGCGPAARLFREALEKTCEGAHVPPERAWEMFLHSLLLRVGHYQSMGNPLAENHSRFLHFALQNRSSFVFQSG